MRSGMMAKLTVIDFFCGAGGFSEGFRQQGFDIVQGVDNWRPAIDTFNYNFGLDCAPRSILDFADDIEAINALPNTDVILGSPPCVSFSSSNQCGNADKTLGITLIEVFLRIVAIKKHRPNSNLKAWFMENVSNSAKYTKSQYSFADLQLAEWAKKHGKKPSEIAIDFENNHQILNSSDYGVAQIRKRLFAGEVIEKAHFPEILINVKPAAPISLKQIFKSFPKPFGTKNKITDPHYKNLTLHRNKLTDYSYDTGIYKMRWKGSEYLKVNHPYMGKMHFPENFDKPSRTVTSTKITESREALIYKNEFSKVGDGEYRTPTVREIAVLMSFPISYQFMGSENTKWRLIGNAVCPLVAAAVANQTLKLLRKRGRNTPIISPDFDISKVNNLNNSTKVIFNNPPIRNKNARFRRHPFKIGNMTVALSNYDLETNGQADSRWRTTVTYGTGQGFKLQKSGTRREQKNINSFIIDNFDDGEKFIEKVHNGFSEKIAIGAELQEMYENNNSNEKLNPIDLIDDVAQLVSKYANGEVVNTGKIFHHKECVHKRQLYALYALNQISLICNKK